MHAIGSGLWCFIVELECFVFIMLLVAFFILSERKFLGYIQLRKGPNKVGLMGLLQSFADFYKLVVKVIQVDGYAFRSWFGALGCLLIFFGGVFFSILYSVALLGVEYNNWFLFFLLVSSLMSYSVLMLGWGSGSKYGLIGGIRMSFASVSFEAIFMCLVLVVGELFYSYNFQSGVLICLLMPVFYYVWWVSVLGEGNRAPLDFGESESEIVSGYNTEYGGLPFVIMFACEYLVIYIFSWVTSSVFFYGYSWVVLLHLVIYIWVRGTFPRIRYNDYVIGLWRGGLVLFLFGVLVMFNL